MYAHPHNQSCTHPRLSYGWRDVASDLRRLLSLFMNRLNRFGYPPAPAHSHLDRVARQLVVTADAMGLIIHPHFLPRQQDKESLQGYLKRTMTNSLQTPDAHVFGLTKCLVFMCSQRSTEAYDEFFCMTLADVIIKCYPKAVMFISPHPLCISPSRLLGVGCQNNIYHQ